MTFHILAQPARIEVMEQKSRFIGVAEPCSDVATFKGVLDDLEAEFSDASHIAFAYRIHTPQQMYSRCHDAGEPAGTAGKPILMHLEAKDLINCAVFVIRYFGGVKLGTGGLARAYGQCAKLVLTSAPIIPYQAMSRYRATVPYGDGKQLEFLLEQIGAKIVDKSFRDCLELEILVPDSEVTDFLGEIKIRLPSAQFSRSF